MWGHPRTGNGDQDLVAKMMVMIMMRSFRGVSHPFNRILSLSLSLSLVAGVGNVEVVCRFGRYGIVRR